MIIGLFERENDEYNEECFCHERPITLKMINSCRCSPTTLVDPGHAWLREFSIMTQTYSITMSVPVIFGTLMQLTDVCTYSFSFKITAFLLRWEDSCSQRSWGVRALMPRPQAKPTTRQPSTHRHPINTKIKQTITLFIHYIFTLSPTEPENEHLWRFCGNQLQKYEVLV